MIDPFPTANGIERRLKALGTAGRAQREKAYLKSELTHLGASVWEVRRVVKEVSGQRRDLTRDDVTGLALALWSAPIHERRMAAVTLLELRRDLLRPGDLSVVERLIRDSHTWAYVDGLGGDVAGSIIARYPDAASTLDRWSTDPNFWIRRAALLALIDSLKLGADFGRFAGYADSMLEEREFFIRKAIGWVLREVGKKRPRAVYGWLLPRAQRASSVTVREAVKYLEPEQRAAVLSAYQRRREVPVRRAGTS